ncbi:Tyrosyl-DNA phosphodiesterase 1 [Hypsibius exemplaris]|uniref:Tyrosyl-DNA phosphodiesterase 1 n=1 Tax=Hypsibius exemplaris TaxID=2072580 RepID=A0A1W0WVA1_HYPEX|nr:Tyrosyl-DNA phosphodiesterase 1 [Hypsibius exemplaris]
MIVHGDRSASAGGQALRQEALLFPNITLAQAPLPIAYGTHHTKMMLLSYDVGMRTQGMWISPLFLKTDSPTAPDSETHFKADLIEYLRTYNMSTLTKLSDSIRHYDMSCARVCLVASSPGRHTGPTKAQFGHLKLRSLLAKHCSTTDSTNQEPWHEWPVIGQFSSIGSLGPTADSWLTGELLETLSTPLTGPLGRRAPLNLIFPTVDNVRLSLEGWAGGGSLPYSEATALKQQYLNKFLHVWKSEEKGRNNCMPHVKTYARVSPDLTRCSWFLMTSANMSKAAWGAMEKASSQVMIRSYEIGVLLLPKFHHPGAATFSISHDCNSPVAQNNCSARPSLFLPYDLPLKEYSQTDRPWTWDGSMAGLKDRFGKCRR